MIRIDSLALLLRWLAFFSCSKNKEVSQEIRPVKVEEVTLRKEVKRDFSGVVDAVKYANLAFRVSGQILELPVVVGQKVQAGDLIAKMDPREISLQYDAAKAQYETAQANLSRNKLLLEHQAVSVQDYVTSQAQFQQAKSNFLAQQDNLSDTYLRSPFAGFIAKLPVENYHRSNSGQTIV